LALNAPNGRMYGLHALAHAVRAHDCLDHRGVATFFTIPELKQKPARSPEVEVVRLRARKAGGLGG
jgi:hypothetical protein